MGNICHNLKQNSADRMCKFKEGHSGVDYCINFADISLEWSLRAYFIHESIISLVSAANHGKKLLHLIAREV